MLYLYLPCNHGMFYLDLLYMNILLLLNNLFHCILVRNLNLLFLLDLIYFDYIVFEYCNFEYFDYRDYCNFDCRNMDLIGLYFYQCYLRDCNLFVLELYNLDLDYYYYWNKYFDYFVDLDNNFDFFDMNLYLDLMNYFLLYYMMS